MSSASKTKAADRQNICKKLVPILRKQYGSKVPENGLPVMESLLLAVCMEDTPCDIGQERYERLLNDFHDLNEVRVSTPTDLARVFPEDPLAEMRAMQIRNILQYVFEENFSFDLEDIRRKTLDQATRQLNRIPELSSFIRLTVLQHPLGNHLIPVDESARRALIWLGLADADTTHDDASALLKSAIRKADGLLFCFLLHSLATDPRYTAEFEQALEAAGDEADGDSAYDLSDAPARLTALFAGKLTSPKKKSASSSAGGTAKSASSKSTADRKSSEAPKKKKKKAAAKSTSKSAAAESSSPAPKKKATKKSSSGQSGKATSGSGRKSSR
ncbi:MAG: hypothetical protein KDA79_02335 [Planctomycetaceae bacterium]|nr:hypothetical protein [Planctomycetaceae bacterium]